VIASFYGTPFAAPLLRLLGCKVGRHCYIGTNLFSEFDLVDIGDYAALNGGAITTRAWRSAPCSGRCRC
jgi:hypothetical protein